MISWFNEGKPREVWTVANILIDNKFTSRDTPCFIMGYEKVLDVSYLNFTLSVYHFSNVQMCHLSQLNLGCLKKNQRSYGETFNSYGNEILFTWCIAKKALSGSDSIFIHLHQILGLHKWKKVYFITIGPKVKLFDTSVSLQGQGSNDHFWPSVKL